MRGLLHGLLLLIFGAEDRQHLSSSRFRFISDSLPFFFRPFTHLHCSMYSMTATAATTSIQRPALPGTTSSPTNSMGRRPPARRSTVPASPSPSSISTNPPARLHATTLPVATPSSTAGEIPHTRAGRPVTSAPAETSMRPPVP